MSEVTSMNINKNEKIVWSDNAKKYILAYLDLEQQAKDSSGKQQVGRILGIRLDVKKSGCSGLAYVIDAVKTPRETDLVFPLIEPYQTYIDEHSYPFLKGLHIDYVQQAFQSKLVFNNPNETGQCGCGESFSVD